MENNFQRIGAISNSHVGRDFEESARAFFQSNGLDLDPGFPAFVGFRKTKEHRFDLGCSDPAVLVECKSYTWTTGGNSPSAKIRSLNEAMLLFSAAPQHYRKILIMLKHLHRGVSLAEHYIKNQAHLIIPGVEIWELDPDVRSGERLL